MKIISLKGENLASLAAPFDVNFASGILADAGLFAICGNTGSGKSTLLDAICLSLFDAMPRFSSSRRGPAIGHNDSQENERLKSNDVRHILTRGAASGFSEVVFALDDGRQYCARWSVKRARGNATGRTQAQEMMLTELATAKVLATKKTEVLSLIEQLIGLNYEQFRRSVLLAQGDFAAFLKAAAKERSELLERITGTEMYSELSKLAFARAKDEEQRLKLLMERLGEVTLLSAEQQEQLISQLASVNELMTVANDRARQLDWLEQQLAQTQQLERQVAISARQCDDAKAEISNQQQMAQLIEQVEHAQRARTIDEQLSANKQNQQQQRSELEHLEAKISQQKLDQINISHQVTQLGEAKTQADSQLEQQLPALENAIVRRLEIAHLSQGQQEKRLQLAEIEQQQESTNRRLTQNFSSQQRQGKLLNELADYLASNQQLSALVNQVTVLEQGITDYLQASTNNQQYDNQALAIKQTIAEAEQQLRQLNHQLYHESEQHQGYQRQLDKLNQSQQTQEISRLERQIENRQGQLTKLFSQQQIANQGLQYQSLIAQKHQQQQDIFEQLEQTKYGYRTARAQLDKLMPVYQEAANSLQGAQQIMSLSEHRAQLVAEQPCALCGSVEHPYANEINLGERLIDQLAGRHEQLGQQRSQLDAKLSQLEAIGNQLVEQQSKITSEVDELNGVLKSLSDTEITPHSLADIETEIAQHQQKLASEKQQQIELTEALEQIRRLEKQAMASQHQLDLLNKNIEQAQIVLQSGTNDLTLTGQYQRQLSEQMAVRLTQLNELYPQANWTQVLNEPQLLDDFKRELATQIDQFIEKTNYQAQLATEQLELEQQHLVLSQQLDHLDSQHQPLNQQLLQLQCQIEQAQHEIDALCQGNEPEQLKASLIEQSQQISTALNNAEQGLMTTKNQQIVSQNQQQHIESQLQNLDRQAQQLAQQWQQWLTKLELSESQLRQLLSYDHQWIIEQRKQQAQLLQQYHQSQAVLAEQQRALALLSDELANHQQQVIDHLPELSPEAAKTSIEQRSMLKQSIVADIKQLEQQQFELRSQLDQHNRAMIRHGELQQHIDQQSIDTQLWLEMKELIGAADGAKFRTFAQSLTLEQMLIAANHHLKELAPRYQLQRVPGAELDLQIIDQDMGDDIRSIESLSGGETFLVSLALALGLGSITSLQTKIKTLFIDEGFGTLDPDTLEVALSCLDSLQASGRQIGLISHVQGLVERVGTRVQITAQGNGHSKVELFAR